jgi:hypothetical protein
MSALRLGRLPDGTRHVLILEPAVGRIHFSKMTIPNGTLVTGESTRARDLRLQREAMNRVRR